MKQLMVRMPGDRANPLMIHVDPYNDPDIPEGANVVTFDGVTNGQIHEQTNGALFQFAWNKLDPGDNCLIDNIEVL
jgi:hypothetical protein